ncbi:MAG: hypothetical protein ABDH28_05995 [Brevinematia bacterium]
MKSYCTISIVLLSVLLSAFSFNSEATIVEFKNKYLKLIFDDVNYRFTLQREFVPSAEYSKDLLFFNIPPTSYIILNIDGMSYNLNEGKVITPPMLTKDGKFSFQCNIQDVVVVVTFSFVKNNYTQEEDSIEVELKLMNRGNVSKNVGVRYLFDTFFGENENKPKFYLDGKNPIDHELLINQNNMISYVVSSSDINHPNSLYIFWTPTPSRIIFSNWRKLNITTWDVEPSPFLRYKFSETSSEDCAVAIFFEGLQLAPNVAKSVKVVLSSSQYFPELEDTKPPQEKVVSVPVVKQEEQKVVFVTNYVFVTNEIVSVKTQEVVSREEVVTTNIVTNFVTNFLTNFMPLSPQVTSPAPVYQIPVVVGNGELKRKVVEIEEKIERLSQSVDKVFSLITNAQVQLAVRKDKELERDVDEIKRIRASMVKLSKTIDTLEERIAMINKYIEIRKKFADKRIVVYSTEEYRNDIRIIEEMSKLLDEIMNEIISSSSFGLE